MENNIKRLDYFSKMPAGLSGLGLGVGGLGNAWAAQLNCKFIKNEFHLTDIQSDQLKIAAISIQSILIFITIVCFVMILIKMIWHFNVFKKELTDPLISSYLPTEMMCLASIGYFIGIASTYNNDVHTYVLNAGTVIGNIIVVTAIIGHISLLSAFVIQVLMKHSVKEHVAYSSWLVPTCGLALSCGFTNELGNLIPSEFFQVTWYFGLVSLLVLLPYLTYKHLFFKALDHDKTPSIAIFFAAPNLLLNGLLTTFNAPNASYYPPTFIYVMGFILLSFSAFGMMIYYSTLYKASRIKFNAGFAALTFPAAISALATVKFGEYIYNQNVGAPSDLSNALHGIIGIFGFWFLVSATLIIFYVLVKYAHIIKIITNEFNKSLKVQHNNIQN